MPIYEYECRKCGRVFEAMHGWNDPAPEKCEFCGARGKGALRRLISASQVVFKGSGFYLTDNRGAKNATLEGARGEDAKPAGKSEDKKETPAAQKNGGKENKTEKK